MGSFFSDKIPRDFLLPKGEGLAAEGHDVERARGAFTPKGGPFAAI